MIAAKLIELIEVHAERLSADVTKDLHANQRTRGFRAVPKDDLQARLFELVHHLGNWIGDPTRRRCRRSSRSGAAAGSARAFP